MPYPVTTGFKQEELKLTQDMLVECFVLDLASVEGTCDFYLTGKKIISRDYAGIFPTTRIIVGDVVQVSGTTSNNTSFTVATIIKRQLTVSESVANETGPLAYFTNYLYFSRTPHNITGFKMQAGSLLNVEQTYTASSIRREDVSTDIQQGKAPTVKITIGNVDRVVEGLIQNRAYLRGCFIYIVSSFAKYFPSGGTYTYIGSTPDFQAFLIEKLVIDGVSSSNKAVTFSCRDKFFFRDSTLPRRMLDREICFWAEDYGGLECDPSGIINKTTFPTCDGTLTQCRERDNTLRYGAFPSIPKVGIYI